MKRSLTSKEKTQFTELAKKIDRLSKDLQGETEQFNLEIELRLGEIREKQEAYNKVIRQFNEFVESQCASLNSIHEKYSDEWSTSDLGLNFIHWLEHWETELEEVSDEFDFPLLEEPEPVSYDQLQADYPSEMLD